MTDTPVRTRATAPAATIGPLLKLAWCNSLVQVGWPQGPVILVSAVGIALLIDVAPQLELTAAPNRRAIAVVILAAAALWLALLIWNVIIAGYMIHKNRAEHTEAELRSATPSAAGFDPEQLQRAMAHYYGRAHTFLFYDLTTNVSLSQNVRAVEVHSAHELTVHFLQALDPATILVRPLGGTPNLEIKLARSRRLRIQLHHSSTFVCLRIFGDIIPAITNHGPNSEVSEVALHCARSA